MRRFCVVAAIVTVIVGQFFTLKAFALATDLALASDEEGNAPLVELNYTAWKGFSKRS